MEEQGQEQRWQHRDRNVATCAFSLVSFLQVHSVAKEGHFPSASLPLALPLGVLLSQIWLLLDTSPNSTLAFLWDEKLVISRLLSGSPLLLLPRPQTPLHPPLPQQSLQDPQCQPSEVGGRVSEIIGHQCPRQGAGHRLSFLQAMTPSKSFNLHGPPSSQV